MATYIDTSILVSALDPSDDLHIPARACLDEVAQGVITELVVTEFFNVVLRREDLSSQLEALVPESKELSPYEKTLSLLLYLLKRFKLTYFEVRMSKRSLAFGRIYAPLAQTLRLSQILRMKTLDVMHVAYAYLVNKQTPKFLEFIATEDEDFHKNEKQIEEVTGLRVRYLEGH
ncbi:MAG: PIN domain-containing protein [Candidatus Brockarchaeota archaeon]|nr:PIN domain-containing protein [Candidatus Brockarchaeota archaeon]